MSVNSDHSGWVKIFSNEQLPIFGNDTDVDANRMSWRRTPLDSMINGAVRHVDEDLKLQVQISGPGSYWQSDDLMAPFQLNATVQGIRTARRIEKQILSEDKYLYIRQDESSLDILVEHFQTSLDGYQQVVIEPEQVGQWVIGEIDMIHNQFKWYISKAMI